MKLQAFSKYRAMMALLMIGLAGSSPLLAHPGGTEHAHVTGQPHLLIHAAAGVPLLALAVFFAVLMARHLFRRGHRRMPVKSAAMKQE